MDGQSSLKSDSSLVSDSADENTANKTMNQSKSRFEDSYSNLIKPACETQEEKGDRKGPKLI